MSNIKDAITHATREALKNYLAKDLVEQLTEEIIQRAAPQMEEALRAMAGFELGRPGTVRHKPTQLTGRKLGKAKKDDVRPEAYLSKAPEPVMRENGSAAGEGGMHLT